MNRAGRANWARLRKRGEGYAGIYSSAFCNYRIAIYDAGFSESAGITSLPQHCTLSFLLHSNLTYISLQPQTTAILSCLFNFKAPNSICPHNPTQQTLPAQRSTPQPSRNPPRPNPLLPSHIRTNPTNPQIPTPLPTLSLHNHQLPKRRVIFHGLPSTQREELLFGGIASAVTVTSTNSASSGSRTRSNVRLRVRVCAGVSRSVTPVPPSSRDLKRPGKASEEAKLISHFVFDFHAYVGGERDVAGADEEEGRIEWDGDCGGEEWEVVVVWVFVEGEAEADEAVAGVEGGVGVEEGEVVGESGRVGGNGGRGVMGRW
jgi:hypothetical protein